MKTSAVFIIVLLAWACQQADSMKLMVEIVPKLTPPAGSEVSPGIIPIGMTGATSIYFFSYYI